MELHTFSNPVPFREEVLPFLLQHEAENNLMISIITRLADGTARWGDEPPRLFAVKDGGEVIATVTQTPPFNPILTSCQPEVIDYIAERLHQSDLLFCGVLGPRASAEHFAARWRQLTGCNTEGAKGLGLYQLDSVLSVSGVPGQMEDAGEEDIALYIRWMQEFEMETRACMSDIEPMLRRSIAERRLAVWKDSQTVSTAACCGPTPHGIRITNVYTPPPCRRRGYASALVAALSQRLLDAGYQFCYLFTDLSNPTSNSIYRKIGYRQIGEFAEYRFHA